MYKFTRDYERGVVMLDELIEKAKKKRYRGRRRKHDKDTEQNA